MKRVSSPALDREILRPLWKVHILHHAEEAPFVANWILEELREHGYRVSPGTLYPLLDRMRALGWLRIVRRPKTRGGPKVPHFGATAAGRRALREVQARLSELQHEVFAAGADR